VVVVVVVVVADEADEIERKANAGTGGGEVSQRKVLEDGSGRDRA
jgi:hypothetical protein